MFFLRLFGSFGPNAGKKQFASAILVAFADLFHFNVDRIDAIDPIPCWKLRPAVGVGKVDFICNDVVNSRIGWGVVRRFK